MNSTHGSLIYVDEPCLLFGHRQAMEDPRDGLFLFGPLDSLPKPHGISAAAIGTRDGIRKFKAWAGRIHQPIYNERNTAGRPFFPGFEAVYRTTLLTDGIIEQEIAHEELDKRLYHNDQHIRTYGTVDLYADRIIESTQNDDYKVDVWFVVIPDDVYKYCRPNSVVPEDLVVSKTVLSKAISKNIVDKDSLFPEITEEAAPYRFEVNFHHQLKARLLGKNITTQILRESTIAPEEYLNHFGKPIRDLGKIKAHVAWTVSTAAYYKAGGRPWKLSNVREGVCYIGLVYKIDLRGSDARNACCAAQMFLDSGDGFVFKGAVGPWYSPKKGEFHLRKPQAKELISLALDSYQKSNSNPPKQLFIHARTSFNEEEWEGFEEATSTETQLTGVTIKSVNHLKLYRIGVYPVLRGIAFVENDKAAYLWSRGYVPRMQTALSLEVPNPLKIEISKGQQDIEVVLRDILALTKLNYNACIYGDGLPVTLRFANAVGEILTAGPSGRTPPLSFKYYI